MAGQGFQDKADKVIRYHASVPDNIRADFQKIFSEMPRDLYEAAITHYHDRGGHITVAEKIRMLNPGYKPFYVGYTEVVPPHTDIQFTQRFDSKEIRPYDDLKRNLYHEVGHVVFADFAGDQVVNRRNFRKVFANTYMEELRKLGFPENKVVADYFLPGFGDADGSKAKEAFCEMLSFDTNGGIHTFNRPDGTPIDVTRDFPKSLALMREAKEAYIKKHDPNVVKPTLLETTQKSQGPDYECKEIEGGIVSCSPKPGSETDKLFKKARESRQPTAP